MIDDVFMLETQLIDAPVALSGISKLSTATVLLTSVVPSTTYTISINASTAETCSMNEFIDANSKGVSGSTRFLIDARPVMAKDVLAETYTGRVSIVNDTLRNISNNERTSDGRTVYKSSDGFTLKTYLDTEFTVGQTDGLRPTYGPQFATYRPDVTAALELLEIPYTKADDGYVSSNFAYTGNSKLTVGFYGYYDIIARSSTGCVKFTKTVDKPIQSIACLKDKGIYTSYPYYIEFPSAIDLTGIRAITMKLKVYYARNLQYLELFLFNEYTPGDNSGNGHYIGNAIQYIPFITGVDSDKTIDVTFPIASTTDSVKYICINDSSISPAIYSIGFESIEFNSIDDASVIIPDRPQPLYTTKWWWATSSSMSLRIIPGKNVKKKMNDDGLLNMGDFVVSILAIGQ
jgi:hypothetical protein